MAQAAMSLGLPGLSELSLPLHHYCYKRNLRCGFAAPADDLGQARIAFVPHLAVWDEEWTADLRSFAQAGGILIVGARTGTRDANNHILETAGPGPLAELCGVTVSEFGRLPARGASGLISGGAFQVEAQRGGAIAESARRAHLIEFDDADRGREPVIAAHGYERLSPHAGTRTIGRWASRWLAGEPAVTRRAIGAGAVIYLGTYLTADLVERLFAPLIAELGIAAPLEVPDGVEVVTRSGPGATLTFLQNTLDKPMDVALPDGTLALAPYGCTVLG
jgi:beta-galactosidase